MQRFWDDSAPDSVLKGIAGGHSVTVVGVFVSCCIV